MIQKNNYLFNLQMSFAVAYPFFSVFGPFLSELCIVLSGIIFLIRTVVISNYKYFKNTFVIILLTSNLYFFFLSIFVASNSILSLESSLFFFRFTIFSIVIWNLLDESKNFIKYFFFSILLIIALIIFDSFFQYIFGFNLLGYKYDGIRLGSFLGNEYLLGSFLWKMEILLLLFYQLYFKKNRTYDYFIILIIILINIIILLSGERTSLFSLIFSSILLIIFTTHIRKIILISFSFSVIFFIIFIISVPSIKSRIIDHTINQIGLNDNNIKVFTEIHQNHYESALKIFNGNKIFGVGPKMFRVECADERYWVHRACATHPHNFYIQLLAETGIFGFIFLLTTFIYFGYLLILGFFKKYSFKIGNESLTISLILLFVYIWPLMPHMNFFNNWINGLPYLTFGIFLYNMKSLKLS